MTCVDDFILSKGLHTRNYIKKKSCYHVHDIIYRPQLSKGNLNVNLQLISFCK